MQAERGKDNLIYVTLSSTDFVFPIKRSLSRIGIELENLSSFTINEKWFDVVRGGEIPLTSQIVMYLPAEEGTCYLSINDLVQDELEKLLRMARQDYSFIAKDWLLVFDFFV